MERKVFILSERDCYVRRVQPGTRRRTWYFDTPQAAKAAYERLVEANR